jgi:CheY-like chemotaxis protein
VRFDEESWDLVITDLVMPQVSGWAVIEGIRHRAPTMPIVLLTALHDPGGVGVPVPEPSALLSLASASGGWRPSIGGDSPVRSN